MGRGAGISPGGGGKNPKQPFFKGPDNTPRYKYMQVGKSRCTVSLSHSAANSGTGMAFSFQALASLFFFYPSLAVPICF